MAFSAHDRAGPLQRVRTVAWTLAFFLLPVEARGDFELVSYTIDGGGFRSEGGPFVAMGTIGQPDAGDSLLGPIYDLFGGFWFGGGILLSGPPGEPVEPPEVHRLYRATPNPFNPRTTLRIDLPRQERVDLRVMDAQGRLVATLVSTTLDAGRHAVSWDGNSDGGAPVASGAYFVVLETETFRSTEHVALLK